MNCSNFYSPFCSQREIFVANGNTGRVTFLFLLIAHCKAFPYWLLVDQSNVNAQKVIYPLCKG